MSALAAMLALKEERTESRATRVEQRVDGERVDDDIGADGVSDSSEDRDSVGVCSIYECATVS